MSTVKPYVIFAKQNAEANGNTITILEQLSCEEREKERGSYYGSLSGLARHLAGGVCFFRKSAVLMPYEPYYGGLR